ncbi:hypothetical protein [Hamadaea tsunoensis]|uniref:hypothetical protein n=1 Tax=Hamadaea tsunoensis TaxID=53368 RepID=UPI001FDEE571|nr:hypothetical protein [Hamadaea tsunoensis]
MRSEKLTFYIESVSAVSEGWRLEGEPGYHPRHWARPGERFVHACHENGRGERAVDLVVLELSSSHTVVTGSGGDQLCPNDIVSGERMVMDTSSVADRLSSPDDAAAHLARLLALPELGIGSGSDWSPVEAELGFALPGDYKLFIDAYGAGMVDDHLMVCGPGGIADWADLLRHNAYARECVRSEFAGPDGDSGVWSLGDASRWAPDRAEVPSWFGPGDDLISWGHTGNGDFLFWHVKPDITPNEWPVAFKERGPFWEYYGAGFGASLAGLLTGDIQSEYLSRWFGGPHTYAF